MKSKGMDASQSRVLEAVEDLVENGSSPKQKTIKLFLTQIKRVADVSDVANRGKKRKAAHNPAPSNRVLRSSRMDGTP